MTLYDANSDKNFREFMFKIALELVSNDIDGFKYLLRPEIGRREVENITSGVKLFEKLEDMGHIKQDNLSKLKNLLRNIGRLDLEDEVGQYEVKERQRKSSAIPKTLVTSEAVSDMDAPLTNENNFKSHCMSNTPLSHSALQPKYLAGIEKDLDLDLEVGKSPQGKPSLHKYQLELAEPGIDGKNNIICAPTGSGKTLTAAHIIQQRKELLLKEKKQFRCIFLLCVRHLVEQQSNELKLLLPKDCVNMMDENDDLVDLINRSNVVVMTAQKFLNAIHNKCVSLRFLDLLIFDECHHADLDHPYNELMRCYLNLKFMNRGEQLPQILGLSASLGTRGGNALNHLVTLCANMDCFIVSHVRNPSNLFELKRKNPKPIIDKTITAETRCSRGFTRLMKEIKDDIFMLMGTKNSLDLEPPYGTKHFENWLTDLKQNSVLKNNRTVAKCCEYLEILNTAVILYNDVEGIDVLKYIKDNLNKSPQHNTEKSCYEFIKSRWSDLELQAQKETVDDNPKLLLLKDLLRKLLMFEPKHRGILLVPTRLHTVALLRFINSSELKDFLVADRLVGQGKLEEAGMTAAMQKTSLANFCKGYSKGGCNVLITTDVAQEAQNIPECKFVIRYNFVSNDIGHVQARGRARDIFSESYLITDKDSQLLYREYRNKMKEAEMEEALQEADKMGDEAFQEKVRKQQSIDQTAYENKMKWKRAHTCRNEGSNVELICKDCHRSLCKGSDMRKKGSNYICIDPEFKDKIITHSLLSPREFPTDVHIATSACKAVDCGQSFGPVLRYKGSSRSTGYTLSIKSVLFIIDGEKRIFKKWSLVPFMVEEEDMFN